LLFIVRWGVVVVHVVHFLLFRLVD
jgi:hypothetical protein